MAFDYPPLTPDPDPAPLSPTIPLNPPMVGEASPFDHVDGQNRDLILESIRSWVRHQLRAWTSAWQAYLVYWLQLVEDWLNGFITAADAYITEHAISGYSFRVTATAIAASGTTDVTITVGLDAEHRPLVVGDLVVDSSIDGRFGVITVVIDGTHATVLPLGTLKGYAGFGWWTTATAITHSGTTAVVIPTDPTRGPQLDDLVVDNSASHAYGLITAIADPTHVTVTYVGTLQGPVGPQGDPGVVQAVIAGDNVAVDSTDPANPIVSAGSPGSSLVETVVAGPNVAVDSTDPANPIVSAVDVVNSVVAGDNVAVDSTDPANPIVIVDGVGFASAPIDPNLTIVNLSDRYGIGTVVGIPGVDNFGVIVYDDHTDLLGSNIVNIGSDNYVRLGSSHSTAVSGALEVHADANGIRMVFNDGSGADLRSLVIIDQKGMHMDTSAGQSGYFGLPPHVGDTTTPLAGFMYWNSVSKTIRVFDGTDWYDLNMTIV